jgi:hypothetical protein
MKTIPSIEPTWSERLAASAEIDIRPVPEGRRAMIPGKTMLYPSAQIVNEAIRAIPAGQTVTPQELRANLARQYGAEYTCPVTLSRMLLIVAEAAHETHEGGAPLTEVTPVWRVLDGKGSFPRRLSFDLGAYLDQRNAELAAR